MSETLNVAERLSRMAAQIPEATAIALPVPKRRGDEARRYTTTTFRQLDQAGDRIAGALIHSGVKPGMRLVLMVRQEDGFVPFFYGILKTGATVVLIDPGMGMRRMIDCLAQTEPDGFVAISPVQAARVFLRHRFPKARHNLTVGRRWFWGGLSASAVLSVERNPEPDPVLVSTRADDPAAIIFTSGSTGPPKGVLYTHRVFDTQVDRIAERLDITPGEIDLAGFPFFGLFNAAMGTTAVIPEMDATRPAKIDPETFLETAADWNITQSFGSPALWNRVCAYCEEHGRTIPTLRRCILAGAPISPAMLERVSRIISPEGDVYTPYGATEALPVAVIGAREVLAETAEQTRRGRGICVGKRFGGVDWKIIRITEEPIATLDDVEELPVGEIGELIVAGLQVTQRYVTGEADANVKSKIAEPEKNRFWHRMGDVGRLDDRDRFWFCGRKGHRVETVYGTLFTIPCEAIFNRHPDVYRSALAGAAPLENARTGNSHAIPWMFVEPLPGRMPKTDRDREKLLAELRDLAASSPLTEHIEHVSLLEAFPVDVRHNAKINRERLSEIATENFRNG